LLHFFFELQPLLLAVAAVGTLVLWLNVPEKVFGLVAVMHQLLSWQYDQKYEEHSESR
jgi:hypothetical protein